MPHLFQPPSLIRALQGQCQRFLVRQPALALPFRCGVEKGASSRGLARKNGAGRSRSRTDELLIACCADRASAIDRSRSPPFDFAISISGTFGRLRSCGALGQGLFSPAFSPFPILLSHPWHMPRNRLREGGSRSAAAGLPLSFSRFPTLSTR